MAGAFAPAAATDGSQPTGGNARPQYMYDVRHTGYQPDTTITAANADSLKPVVSLNPGSNSKLDSIFAQPIASRGRVYVGDWDGYEYAFNKSGHVDWRTYLGRTVAPNQPSGCQPPKAGVSSTPTIVSMRLHGHVRQVMFVGGGGPQHPMQNTGPVYFYALDAQTGHIVWKHQIGTAPQQYVWSSPTYYRGSVYFGIASFGDCPEVQGKVVKLNARSGKRQAVFNTVPNRCRGGAVWSSPTIDPRTGAIYVTTGNGVLTGSIQRCTNARLKYAWSILKLAGSNLRLIDHWQVPASQRDNTFDSDFGTTPTLFTDTSGRRLVGASNKNGLYYAWDRSDLAAGPVWDRRVAVGGACPQCGKAAISPAAFDGRHLFIAGGILQLNDGTKVGGNVQEVDPATGQRIWIHTFPTGPKPPPSVLGAVTATASTVVVGSARNLVVLDKTSGDAVYTFTAPADSGKPPAYFWGAPEVSGDHIWAGNMAGGLYGLALPSS